MNYVLDIRLNERLEIKGEVKEYAILYDTGRIDVGMYLNGDAQRPHLRVLKKVDLTGLTNFARAHTAIVFALNIAPYDVFEVARCLRLLLDEDAAMEVISNHMDRRWVYNNLDQNNPRITTPDPYFLIAQYKKDRQWV